MQRSNLSRPEDILQRPAEIREKRWEIVAGTNEKVGIMLATIYKADLQPREAAAIKGTNEKYRERSENGDPRSWMPRPVPQEE